MNKKRVFCGVLAGTMLLSSNLVYADRLSSIGSSKHGEVKVIGSPYGNDTDAVVEDLTVDEAVEKATAYSRTLQNLEESIEISEIDQMTTRYAWQSNSDATTGVTYSIALRNLNNTLRNYDSNKAAEKEKIVYNVRQVFYGILDAQSSIELYEKQIELSERQLEIYKVMLNVGKLSQVEYDAYETNYESLVSSKLSLENTIAQTFRTLNQLMGTDVNKTYNVIVDDVTYEAVADTLSLDRAITLGLSSNQTLKELEDTVDVAKYTKDTYWYRGITGETTSDKETIDSNYAQSSRSLADAKTALTTSITKVYEDIKNSESEYRQNQASLKDMQNQLVVKETQVKLGKLTQIELDSYKLSVEQLEAEIDSSVRSHDLLIRQFNDSNLIS